MELRILINFCLICYLSGRARSLITTDGNVTATWGTTLTIPCRFDGDPIGVYWHRHKTTGDLVSATKTVVTNFLGSKIINDTRYDITNDYSMVIKNVTAEDETTFSCDVALEDGYDGKNYTDVRVVAFGSPKVCDCVPNKTAGACLYSFGKGGVDKMTCEVAFVRPRVNISWISESGEPPAMGKLIETPTGIYGLITVSRVARIYKSDSIGSTFICVAEGEAVNGRANVTVTVTEPELSSLERRLITAAFVVNVILITVAEVFCVYRCYQKRKGRRNNLPEALALAQNTSEDERQDKINALVDKIQNYRPGSFGKKERPEASLPDKICLGLSGPSGSGKSSFIRTMYFACHGTDMDIEVTGLTAEGGLTCDKKFYEITNSISIKDDKGLHEMDTRYVPEMTTNVVQADISCPIFVFNLGTETTQLSDLTPLMTAPSDGIHKLFDSYPVLVLTHRDEIPKERDVRKEAAECTSLPLQRIFLVRSLTKEDKPDPDLPDHQAIRLEFLELLENLLEITDDILISNINRPPPPYTGSEMVDDAVDVGSTKIEVD